MASDPGGGTPPPGVRSQTMARNAARWLALLVIVVAAVVALVGCSSDGPADGATPSDPHAGNGSAEGTAPASSPAATGPAPEAVAAGIGRAASYNFTLSSAASAQDLEALRAAPQDTLDGASVRPATCSTAVQDLNWSPALLGDEAARTDFAADGVRATGSIEVARIGDRSSLDEHYATVKTMLGDCADATLSLSGTEVPLRSTAPRVATSAGATSSLLWTRASAGSDLQQQGLVLIGERQGYVAMVSFIAPDGLDDAKFAQMAGGILDATLKDLG